MSADNEGAGWCQDSKMCWALMNEVSITGGGPLSIACEMLKYWCTLDFQHWAYYIALDIKQEYY